MKRSLAWSFLSRALWVADYTNKLTVVLFVLGICSAFGLRAQDSNLIIGNTASDVLLLQEFDEITAKRRKEIPRFDLHTSFAPYKGEISIGPAPVNHDNPPRSRGYIYRKLRLENFIEVDTGDFYLIINPAFNFEAGRDRQDTSSERLYVNTRGLSIHGKIGRNVTFFSRFYENQAFLPTYLDDFVSEHDVVPGQGRIKPFKTTGYDYAMASGVVSFSVNKRLNIQLGNGKHFLGDGYRSLALSRNAFNYPFVKITSWFGPLQYTNLFMGLQNLNVSLPTATTTEPRFQRKIGTIHHLDWAVNKWLTLGAFEQMIWATSNTKGKFEMNDDVLSFINPIPFIRPFQYGLSGENNVIVGINGKIMWPRKTELYGQIVLDDNKAGKYGFQMGFKTWAIRNLMVRAEFNQVAPYTYGHADSTRNFAHYNQGLAHPLGAGFSEMYGSVSYFIKDFFLLIQANYASYDDDESSYHWGKDIFKSDNSKSPEQIVPASSTLFYQRAGLGYQINRVTGMQISLGLINRMERKSSRTDQTQYVFLSFSTNIPGRIYDY